MSNQTDFIECTCPNCQANIIIADGTDDAYCSHCGTKFIVRESDAVKISRIENQTELENIRLKAELDNAKEKHKYVKQIIEYLIMLVMIAVLAGIILLPR